MSSHGGILGVAIAMILFSRVHRVPLYISLDITSIGASVGIFFGRIANFINGELYGRVIEKKALLGVKFPTEMFAWATKPAEYQPELFSLKSLLPHMNEILKGDSWIPNFATWKEWVIQAPLDSFYQDRVTHVVYNLIQLSEQGHIAIQESLEPILALRHPSQFYQAILGGLIPFLIIFSLWSYKKWKPGLISFIWILSYLLARFVTEFFRVPDIHMGYQFLNLTQGQWLSGLILVFAILYGWSVHKTSPQGFFSDSTK